MSATLVERSIRVSAAPPIDLYVAETPAAADHTLLVIHGGPDWDHTYLIEPLRGLGSRRHIMWPDLRGCGRSTRGLAPHDCSAEAVVRDLLALVDQSHVSTIDVLGFSYGGCVAQRLALTAPDRIRRLIIASSTAVPLPADAFAGWTERERMVKPVEEIWDRSALEGAALTRSAAYAALPMSVSRAQSCPEWKRRLDTIRFSGDWLNAWRTGTLGTALPVDAPARLKALNTPILFLHGRQDMVFPVDLAVRAADLIPQARCVIVENAGHMAHVDQPVKWLSAVSAFL